MPTRPSTTASRSRSSTRCATPTARSAPRSAARSPTSTASTGLPEGLLEINLTGSAGQSLGAFLSPGLRLILVGEANDYVGKSMSGGVIVIKPRAEHKFVAGARR